MSAGHAHHHPHAHGAHASGGGQARLVGACVLTWGYAAVEAMGGWQANSLALQAKPPSRQA